MHEMALCESIVGIVEDEAGRHHFSRVKTISLEIGKLSHVSREALEFCFAAVAAGTPAEGARLKIRDVAGAAWCDVCNAAVAVSERYDPCPRCGRLGLRLTAGEEMRVGELEVE